jgi:acetolactate synthase-1/2/3 large subunit
MTTVAETIAHVLQANGVTVVFGLPGGETVEVLDALRRVGIRFVLAHSESSAAFMADAHARLSGGVGVCLTTLGPGACNAVMGVAHAYLDRSPLLIITAQKPDHLLPGYTHQVLDLQVLFAPVTKGSFKVTSGNASSVTQAALDLARGGRPGAVHLQVSNEDAGQEALAGRSSASTSTRASTSTIGQASRIVGGARRPVVVVGLGLEPERPYAALRELAEAANAPVVVTPKGKGALPDDHPLAAGVIGLTMRDPAYTLLDEADCIIAVGFDVVELVKPWRQDASLIWVASWENRDPTLPAVAEIIGPITLTLDRLIAEHFSTDRDWGARRVAGCRAALAALPLPDPAPGRLLPQQLLACLRAAASPETPLVVDVGSHKIFASLAWPTLAPNRFLVSNGLSSMGYGLPGAIGASLALPGQPVLCLTGDAGLAMALGDLALLAQAQLPVVVVVCNDSALDLIRSAQLRASKPIYGVEFTNPDFCALAGAFGIRATRVATKDECAVAVEEAFVSGAPWLIEAMIDPVGYPTTVTRRQP